MAGRLADLLLPSRRDAWGFAAGLVVGLVTLALLGRSYAAQNHITKFERFHRLINPESSYYPTASEVTALARSFADDGRIPVIIGGTSVLYGATQPQSELWSLALQAALGDRFAVVNLAFPAGHATEHGAVAAQALIKDGTEVVYVADIRPALGFVPRSYGCRYQYVVWDAFYKGLLLPSDTWRYPLGPPDSIPGDRRTQGCGDSPGECRIRAMLDAVLYFSDFWNGLGYTSVFTIWSPYVAPFAPFTTARQELNDDLQSYPKELRYTSPTFESSMLNVRATALVACPDGSEGGSASERDDRNIVDFAAAADLAFPPELRRHTVIILTYQSPYYTGRLSESEQHCYRRTFELAEAVLARLGIRTHIAGADWTVDDYDDQLHLSPGGGRKLAADIVEVVREVASRSEIVGAVP